MQGMPTVNLIPFFSTIRPVAVIISPRSKPLVDSYANRRTQVLVGWCDLPSRGRSHRNAASLARPRNGPNPEPKTVIDQLARALAPHIDETGAAPRARTLGDLTHDPYTRTNIWRLLAVKGIRRSHFLHWRDVLSTATLGDALTRMDSGNISKSHARGPLLPAWVMRRVVVKPGYPGSAIRAVEIILERLLEYKLLEQVDAVDVCLDLCFRYRLYSVLPIVVDRCLELVSRLSPDQAATMLALGMKVLCRLVDRVSTDGKTHGPEGLIVRTQLARLVLIATSPDQRPLSAQQLYDLFGVNHLSLESIPALTAYLLRNGVNMTARAARNSMILANRNRRPDLAEKFGKLAVAAGGKVPSSDLDSSSSAAPREEHKASWITALGPASRMRSISGSKWDRLVRSGPQADYTPAMVAPIMYGYLVRGRPDQALEYWNAMVRSGQEPDVVVLTVAAQALLAEEKAVDAISLVDRHAWKVDMSQPNEESAAPQGCKLDAYAINILLEGCNRANLPDIAYRVWSAMRARWGVPPDGISLAIIIATGDHASRARARDRSVTGATGAALLREFMSEFRQTLRFGGGARAMVSPEDSVAFEHAQRDAGLWNRDIEGILTRRGDGEKVDEYGWREAKSLFEDVIRSHWPHLDTKDPRSAIRPGELPSDQFATPNSQAFHAYITLLMHRGLIPEVIQMLEKMKLIGILPERRTLLRVLTRVDEETIMLSDTARRWSDRNPGYVARGLGRAVGKESQVGSLRAWLVEWLGIDAVPGVGELEDYVRAGLEAGV